MVDNIKLPEAEYESKLNEYIESRGGNLGSGFGGKWAYYMKMEREFQAETGITMEPGPASQARPGSFKDFIKHQG